MQNIICISVLETSVEHCKKLHIKLKCKEAYTKKDNIWYFLNDFTFHVPLHAI